MSTETNSQDQKNECSSPSITFTTSILSTPNSTTNTMTMIMPTLMTEGCGTPPPQDTTSNPTNNNVTLTQNQNNIPPNPTTHVESIDNNNKNYDYTLHDLKDQLAVLNQAMGLLTGMITATENSSSIATTATYAQSTIRSHATHHHDASYYKQQIEKLESNWKLEETQFARLYNACQQLQDTLTHTADEADVAIQDLSKTNNDLVRTRKEVSNQNDKLVILEKENYELHEMNKKLVMETKLHKRQKKILAKSLKDFMTNQDGTTVEEQSLQTPTSSPVLHATDKKTGEKGSHNHPTNDDDEQNDQVPLQPYLPTSFELSPLSPHSSSSSMSCSSPSNEEEWEEVSCSTTVTSPFSSSSSSFTPLSPSASSTTSTTSSSSSLVTDHGCATVKLYPQRKRGRWGKVVSNTVAAATRKTLRPSNETSFIFPSTKDIGLQFTSTTLSSTGIQQEALLVCGFVGYDYTANKRRPTFGSRLVRIDHISLEKEQWKMEDLVEYLKKNSTSRMEGEGEDDVNDHMKCNEGQQPQRPRSVTLVFRSELLSSEQVKVLNRRKLPQRVQ